jgi:hypothetical protein
LDISDEYRQQLGILTSKKMMKRPENIAAAPELMQIGILLPQAEACFGTTRSHALLRVSVVETFSRRLGS